MALHALSLVMILAMAGYSSAAYCVCNSGLSDSVLQKNIDYACGAGADCGQINQNGACYNPNTVKDHCNVAVNSYFQKKGQAPLSCDFSGTASVTQSAPPGATSACFSGNPSTSTPTNPTTAPAGNGTSTGMGTGTGTGAGTGTGINTNPSFGGLAPSGTTGMNDNSGVITTHGCTAGFVLLTLLVSGSVWSSLI